MSTVITPGAGQSVVTTDDDRNSWGNQCSRRFGDLEVSANFRTLFGSVTDNAKDSAVGFKDGQAVAYQIEGRQNVQAALNASAIQVQAEKLAAATVLQAEKLAAAATVQAEKLHTEAAMQAERLAAAATLAACQQTAELKAEILRCCCESQKLTIEKTQDVLNRMNEIEIARQAVLLSDAKAELAALRAACCPPCGAASR